MFVKFVCSNNYAGCDEEFYEKYDEDVSEEELDEYANEILTCSYGFYEPDDRFCDTEDDEEVENYKEYCSVYWEEISEEEYLEEKEYQKNCR